MLLIFYSVYLNDLLKMKITLIYLSCIFLGTLKAEATEEYTGEVELRQCFDAQSPPISGSVNGGDRTRST